MSWAFILLLLFFVCALVTLGLSDCRSAHSDLKHRVICANHAIFNSPCPSRRGLASWYMSKYRAAKGDPLEKCQQTWFIFYFFVNFEGRLRDCRAWELEIVNWKKFLNDRLYPKAVVFFYFPREN